MLRFPSLERAEAFLADPRYLECKTSYRDVAYEVLNLSFFTPRPPKTSLPQPREVAQQAFDHFKQGLATGTWNSFFAMLTDDFTFWFPIGKYQGLNIGKERAIEFFTYVSQTVYPKGLFAQLDRVTGSGSTVIFEFRDEGLLFGTEPYQNRVAVAFEVRGEQICAYREYFGSDGKSN
ncbi:MAG: nuclear transport factor 2 family protein [Blastocatellia bacterium]|nr:nuclear transport factor 2 family protein [Blastocatellia bacterium]